MKLLLIAVILLNNISVYSQNDETSFSGYLGITSLYIQNSDGEKFCEFMCLNENKIVYLMLYFDEQQDLEVSQEESDSGRITFTVVYAGEDGFNTGAEFLIHFSKFNKNYFEYNSYLRRLDGYFKIWNINGPRQGLLSVNLIPVKPD